MRYGDGGGVDRAERARREQVRRRAWVAGDAHALASKGPSGPDPKLSNEQLARLKARLERGPAAAGYGEDQRWTLARVVALIATMFHLRVGITTAWQAMRRLGYTPQLPIHRAIERDEQAIAHWRRYQWPAVKSRGPHGRMDRFADECGHTLRAHKATTWAPKGATPIVKVTAKGTVRVSVAGLCCYRPGHPSRLIYRTLLYRGRKGEPKGFREPDLIRLLDAAHQQLQAPIVLVWDGLSAHKSPPIRAAITARPWLRVYQLPAYAPELNPAEKVWSTMKRSLANHCAQTATDLLTAVKNQLKRMQYRAGLIDSYLTGTGLSPPTPTRP